MTPSFLDLYLERIFSLLNDENQIVRFRAIEALKRIKGEFLVKREKLHIYVHLVFSKLKESEHHLKNGCTFLQSLFECIKQQNISNFKIQYRSIGIELLNIISQMHTE